MTDYSVFVVFFMMLPVTIQIIIPLLMLAGFGLVCFVTTVFRKRIITGGLKDGVTLPEGLQVGRS